MAAKRSGARVREPLQVYLTSDERRLLDRLAAENGLARAEVMRQGIRLFARERNSAVSPMLQFVERLRGADWPADIGREHDRHLQEAILQEHKPKPKRP